MALEVEIKKRLPNFTLDVNFAAGDKPVGILGASGAGKSMTLRVIAGLEAGVEGRAVLNGRVLFDSAKGIHLPTRARRVGMVFQHYALFPHLTVEQNISFGLRGLASPERARRAGEQMAAMHLSSFARRHPATISGGEQQRVALARALAPQPAALLLDEPFSALDTYLRSELERQLHETLTGYRGATLLVSHNLEEIYRLCGELVVLDKGRVIARGAREEIFRRPPDRRTAELTGCKNFSRARASGDRQVEAFDWGCTLRVAQEIPHSFQSAHQAGVTATGHLGIRAHHIEVTATPAISSSLPLAENTFPAWLMDATEGPFRVTLYLRLHRPPAASEGHHLQVEISREHWLELKSCSLPWSVRLDPERILLLPD
jgi:molybdate transport system permease protein